MVNVSAIDLSLLEQEVQELLGMVKCNKTDFVVWNATMMKKLESIHAITVRLQTSGK